MSAEVLGVVEVLPEDKLHYAEALKEGIKGFEEAYAIFTDPDFDSRKGWTKEAEDGDSVVHSLKIEHGKLFCARFEVNTDIETLIHDNWHCAPQMPEWNRHVEFCNMLVTLTDNVNIVHYGNRSVLMISGRDFVSIRVKREVDGVIYTSGRSVDAPCSPPAGNRVRALIKLGGGRMRPHPTKPQCTIVEFMHCIEFGGVIPRRLIDANMGKMMLKDILDHQKHANGLKQRDARSS